MSEEAKVLSVIVFGIVLLIALLFGGCLLEIYIRGNISKECRIAAINKGMSGAEVALACK